MRILFLTQDLPTSRDEVIVSGAVKNPFHLVSELQRRGHEISIVSFDRLAHGACRGSFGPSPVRRYRARLLRLAPKTLWLNARSALAVAHEARRADLVQSHHPHFTIQVAVLKRLGLVRAPLLVKAHGTGFPELAANRYRGIKGRVLRMNARIHLHFDRFVFACAEKTLSSSAFQSDEMVALYGVRRERLATIYNGFAAESRSTARRSAREGTAHLLFVGRLVPKKGVDQFVAIVRALAARRDVRATMVLGRSDDKEDPSVYRAHVVPLRNDPRFTIRFDVPESEMPRIHADADVLVVPSRGYESVPTVIYEAHAAGATVFATREWGIKEVVRPEFALTGDAATDADAIHAYLTRAPERGVTPPSQAYATAEFSWSAIADRFESLYAELVAPR